MNRILVLDILNMDLPKLPGISYKRHRYPSSIISYALWLYHRMPISLRLVEEALSYRGLDISYETIRRWSNKFSGIIANQLRKKRSKPKGKWHVDEVHIKIKGQKYWLWRAIDEDGVELDILLQPRRNAQAAIRFFKKLLDNYDQPRIIISDKLKSYPKAIKNLMPSAEHRRHKGLNNQIEVSHQPTRLFEKAKRKFKHPPNTQLFLTLQGQLRNHFALSRHLITRQDYKNKITQALNIWNDVTQPQVNYA